MNNFYSLKKYVERNGSSYTLDTTEEEKKLLVFTSRIYVWHFDTYLNSACRNIPYQKDRLKKHFDVDIYHLRKGNLYPIGNTLIDHDKYCMKVPNPFFDLTILTSLDNQIVFDYYVSIIKRNILLMYNIFMEFRLSVKTPLTVYRGLILKKEQSFIPFLHLWTFKTPIF